MTMVVLFTGCQKQEKVLLKYRITWAENSGRADVIEELVEAFNSQDPDVQVELIGGNEDVEAYREILDEGVTDILVVPYRYLKYADIADELVILDEHMEALKTVYFPSIMEMSKYQGHVVGMPWIGHSMAMIYNKNMTDAHGIDPDSWRSLDDLVNACEIIRKETGHGAIGMVGADHHDLSWMVTQFIYGFGGQLVEMDANGDFLDIAVDSKSAVQGVEFYIHTLGQYGQDHWQDHMGTDVMEAFANQQITFEIQGPWGVTDIWKHGNPF